jgi:molybdate transport system substrate-binding protein
MDTDMGAWQMKLVRLMLALPSLALPIAAAAQLHVIISGGFGGAYEQLVPEFERNTGIEVVTAAATVAGSKQPDAAKQLIEFLASEKSRAAIRRSGMEPLGKR